jgi:hypothetical protein
MRVCTGTVWFMLGSTSNVCEYSNECLGSIKRRELLGSLNDLASQEAFCCMEVIQFCSQQWRFRHTCNLSATAVDKLYLDCVLRFWWESPKERDHSEDQGVGGRVESVWILGRLAWGMSIGLDWLRIGTGGGLFWVRWWTFGFLHHGVS